MKYFLIYFHFISQANYGTGAFRMRCEDCVIDGPDIHEQKAKEFYHWDKTIVVVDSIIQVSENRYNQRPYKTKVTGYFEEYEYLNKNGPDISAGAAGATQ